MRCCPLNPNRTAIVRTLTMTRTFTLLFLLATASIAIATAAPDNPDHAERIRERLPGRLQELREAMGLSNVRLGS